MKANAIDSEALNDYLEEFAAEEPALLRELREKTYAEFDDAHMLSGHVQGRLLSLISKILKPKHILEIGTYTGYATLCLAEGLDTDGKITTLDKNEELQKVFDGFFERSGYASQINFVVGKAKDYLQDAEDEYDLVFIDADKRGYVDYLDLVLPKMPSGGVILADNVLWKGKVYDADKQDNMTQALRDFNAYVKQDKRVENVILPLRDGVNLIRKI
ncbi:MAG: O-methyltransferase [Weeksellaceae bacterium]|nr:O-methyltransferase [Weeksellaceae bacterium]